MSSMKEMAIRDYISKIDFKHDDWKISEIKENRSVFPVTDYQPPS